MSRVTVVQRVLPAYRIPLFELLSRHDSVELTVVHGQPLSEEAITGNEQHQLHTTEVRNLYRKGGRTFKAVHQRGIVSAVRASNPEVVIVEANPRLSSAYLVPWAMRRMEVPVIGWGLGLVSGPVGSSRFTLPVMRSLVKRFSAILAYHADAKRTYEGLGARPDRVFVAPNSTISKADIVNGNEPSRSVSGPLRVAYLGRLTAHKNLSALVEAIGSMERGSVRLIVIGDGPERARLQRLTEERNVDAQFTGHLPSEVARDCLRREADVVVLPGLGGLALVDAMGAGLPVIATAGDGIGHELVIDGETGFRLPDSPSAEHIAQILRTTGQSELAEMGARARALIASERTLESTVTAFVRAVGYVSSEECG